MTFVSYKSYLTINNRSIQFQFKDYKKSLKLNITFHNGSYK